MTEEKYSLEGKLNIEEIDERMWVEMIGPMGLCTNLVHWLANLPPSLSYYRVRITVEVLHDQPLEDNVQV